jgi:hypothetical protein
MSKIGYSTIEDANNTVDAPLSIENSRNKPSSTSRSEDIRYSCLVFSCSDTEFNTILTILGILITVGILILISSFILFFFQGAAVIGPQCTPKLSAPYLYVTNHSGHIVEKISRDGCVINDNILVDPTSKRDHAKYRSEKESFRSMYLGNYMGKQDNLFIAAATGDYSLIIYGPCSNSSSYRELLAVAVDKKLIRGSDHAYGISQDPNNNIYLSFQHTDVVIRFSNSSLEPLMPLPSALQRSENPSDPYYNGTFFQYGAPGKVRKKMDQGIRSIISVGETLWIAYERLDCVKIVSFKSGEELHTISISRPIGLFYDENNAVYIGSRENVNGVVFTADAKSFKISDKTFKHEKCFHPTGLAAYNDTLFVACHHINGIVTFDIESRSYLGPILERSTRKKDFRIEQIILSMC